ncbi:kinase-like domain-containing protein [Mycena filopes]|nr:kinase-like domain-containing protein [Mycena filopes]
MSESWSEPYEEHIKRHHLPILDGRVSLRTDVPIIRDGGYADVHMGTLTSDDVGSFQEDVAVKMVRGRSINPSHIKKFLQEAHTWSKLNHEHILPLLGITLKLDDSLSIISPWMANGSAKKYVNLDPSRDPRPLLKDVATGLHYLHTRPKKVYHGDLKGVSWFELLLIFNPVTISSQENIMVSNDGRAILADFGFSALDGSSSFSLPITHPTGGTQKWTAPEKLAGKGDSVAADMYSFAMVTVELFTRKDPFEGERGLSLQALQNGKRPARPTPDLTYDRFTDNWWTLCRLCWHGEPSERWTSTEVLDFLGKIESPRTILPLAGVGQEVST